MKVWQILLISLSCFHQVSSLVPDEEMLRLQNQSGLKIVDWSAVSRVVLNQRVATKDPKGICCSTNYSAVWDLDDEIIAFVADNLFCNDTVLALEETVLHDPSRKWENIIQAINRVHKYGPNYEQDYYVGNYPGVTSRLFSTLNPMMLLRRCFQPFLSTILDSEQMFIIRQNLVDDRSNLLNEPNHLGDHLDAVQMMLLDGSGQAEEFFFSEVKEEEDNDDDDDEDEDASATSNDFQMLNNPIFPKFAHSFWASAALPPENLTYLHSSPHTDGTLVGMASVYTLTRNKSYHATATTFNRMRKSKDSLITSQQLIKNFGIEVSIAQRAAIAAGESAHSGWLNETSNRFSEIIAMSYNTHNRFTIYPSNRLHTAYIPDVNLLHSDPSIGRLSLNTFWDTYVPAEDFCKNTMTFLAITEWNRYSVIPRSPEQVLLMCQRCSSWQNSCGWCASTSECIGRDDDRTATSMCPADQIVGAFGSDPNLTCEDAAERASKCVSHSDCKSCVIDVASRCTWCSATGVCKPAYHDASKAEEPWYNPCSLDKFNSVLPGQTQHCRAGFENIDCSVYALCHECRNNKCAWCFENQHCMADTQPSMCGKNGGGGVATITTVGNKDHQQCLEIPKDLKLANYYPAADECAKSSTCTSCIQTSGCAWCINKVNQSTGACHPDRPRVCEGPSLHVSNRTDKLSENIETVENKCPKQNTKERLQIAPPGQEVPTELELVVDALVDTISFVKDLPANSYALGQVGWLKESSDMHNVVALHKDITGIPLVLEFTMENCGPCQTFGPIYAEAAKKYMGHMAFYSIDADESDALIAECNIEMMPTFHVWENGNMVREAKGMPPKEVLALLEAVHRDNEKKGTYVGQFVTLESLKSFYKKHDISKVADVENIMEKFGVKTAKLMRLLKRTYGEIPKLEHRSLSSIMGGVGGAAIIGGKVPKVLSSFSTDDLRAELMQRSLQEQANSNIEYPFITELGSALATVNNPAKVIILGGGPAGLTAAIYTARAGLNPIVVAPVLGGQLLGKGVDVENYPGISGSDATGHGIVRMMRKQVAALNTTMLDDVVLDVNVSSRPFIITVNGSMTKIYTHSLIIATGSESKWLGVPGEYKYRGSGKGISTCATCDAFMYRNHAVAVIGGGDTAMEDALMLARTSNNVTIIHRGEKFKASHILSTRVLAHPKINVMWNTIVQEFVGNDDNTLLKGVVVKSSTSSINAVAIGTLNFIPIRAAFIAIGHDPNMGFLQHSTLTLDGNDSKEDESFSAEISTSTNVEGVFACGDVVDRVYRQAITSAGSGAMAALDAERWLNREQK
jgi:thioredoxin reductase/thiol-disulfide isomerase/thioredoxin